MRDWLSLSIEAIRTDIMCAYLYGSALRPESNPRDVDIIIVTRSGAGSATWIRVRSFCENLSQNFVETFGLPLSVMIATPTEWPEIEEVVVRERITL
jgi:predicted nucleotidyltransferase